MKIKKNQLNFNKPKEKIYMFDDEILEVERRALILFLSQVSFKLNLKREANSKKKFSKYIITSDDKTFNVSFDFEDPKRIQVNYYTKLLYLSSMNLILF